MGFSLSRILREIPTTGGMKYVGTHAPQLEGWNPSSLIDLPSGKLSDLALDFLIDLPSVINLEADISDLALSKQTLIWNRALKWFLKFAETPCFADLKTGLRCLHVVGYSILSIGFPCRINGRCKLDNMIQLWEYFHPAGAVKTRRDLKGPWIPSSKIAHGGG